MAVPGLLQVVASVAVLAASAAYFFTRLHHARMLLLERQRQGLVRCSAPSINPPLLNTRSL